MIVYLNGEYMPAEEAKISPFDRGFLFGDGIYDATPSYDGKAVALQLHLDRMNRGLESIGIENPLTDQQWRDVAKNLSEKMAAKILVYISMLAVVMRGVAFKAFLQISKQPSLPW